MIGPTGFMAGPKPEKARAIPPLLSVQCPYCKADVGEACHINRRNVSIAVLGVHKPRAQRVAKTKGRRRL